MITIRLTFPAGRYHATAWGRHVNEGVTEWPPSPYRLLRALYDVWQRKCYDIPAEDVREVLEALASDLPRFQLPRAVATHTRSYLSSNSTDPADKNLVFDGFLVFNRPEACYICWDSLELTYGARETLARLLGNLNYLGRSESWVSAELWDKVVDGDYNCNVVGADGTSGEMTRVACALPALEYTGKNSWMDALTFSTANLLKERASVPPLLRQLTFIRREDAVETDPAYIPHRKTLEIQEVLLALDSKVLPLVTTTIELAEQIRVRLMGAHKRIAANDESKVSALFSGKEPDGTKRRDHGHVYILPLGNQHDRVDRVLIVSPLRPFNQDEMDAIRGVRNLWQADDRPDVRCVISWQGPRHGVTTERVRVVESATPFVPPRHWRKGRDFEQYLIDEIRRECRNHRLPEPSDVVRLEEMPGLFHEVEYRRNRKNDPVRPGYAFRLIFSDAVETPFAIGYGAHYGLGQFRPERLR